MDDVIGMAAGWLASTQFDLPNMVFFQEINSFLDDEIGEFAGNLLHRVAGILGVVVLSVLTFWILIQGYRIVTGQSREPMMALVSNSLKAVLIIGIATGAAAGADSIYNTVTDGLTEVVNYAVTGSNDDGPYEDIDTTLAIMQVALEMIDSVDTGDNVITTDTKDQALWFAGVGLGGPAIMAGTMLLLNKIAMALIVGLGPLFILCLLFEQTKQLFNKWLFFGIGTLFSLAMLTVMVTLALDMVIAVGLAFWVSSMIPGMGDPESLTSMAMQQGGLGLILTMLIISVPPMAALFFRGVLGHFSGYSAFGQSPGLHTAFTGMRHADASTQSTHAPSYAFRQAGSEMPVDEVKDGSFLARYPNALASNTDAGNGSGWPATPWPIARGDAGVYENLSPPFDPMLLGLSGDSIPPWMLEEVDRENLNIYQGQITFNAEGNDNPDSAYYSRHLHWPMGASGVTLGRGYDMRFRSSETVLLDLLTAGVDRDAAESFANGAGLSGQEARDFVRAHSEEYGEISRRAQRRLFEDVVYPEYVSAARNRYTVATSQTSDALAWDDLDARVRDIAVDLTYQQGRIYRRQMPLISGNDREALARYVETTPELSQYEEGRRRAAYLRGD